MGYRKREKLQRELLFDPEPRISLPGTVEQAAVAVLAARIAQVTQHSSCIGMPCHLVC